MSKKHHDDSTLLSPPGETIMETIEFLGMSQTELALRLGKTPGKVNDLISGKAPITINTALQLEKVLGVDMQFWLNRESLYREKLARIEEEEFLEQCIEWTKEIPVKELKNLGYISPDKKGADLADQCLRFYGVVSPKQWKNMYVEAYVGARFRMSTAHRKALGSMSAWLRIAEIRAANEQIPPYDREMFRAALVAIKEIIPAHPEDFANRLKKFCNEAGVLIYFSQNLPGAPISGAARWFGGRPMIQITDRYKTNDHFWFTFFHEAGHILLHGKKDIFIEDFDGVENDLVKEQEADLFSQQQLFPETILNELALPISEQNIRLLARKQRTHPGIILGRLQKLGRVPYSFGDHLKAKIDLSYFLDI